MHPIFLLRTVALGILGAIALIASAIGEEQSDFEKAQTAKGSVAVAAAFDTMLKGGK